MHARAVGIRVLRRRRLPGRRRARSGWRRSAPRTCPCGKTGCRLRISIIRLVPLQERAGVALLGLHVERLVAVDRVHDRQHLVRVQLVDLGLDPMPSRSYRQGTASSRKLSMPRSSQNRSWGVGSPHRGLARSGPLRLTAGTGTPVGAGPSIAAAPPYLRRVIVGAASDPRASGCVSSCPASSPVTRSGRGAPATPPGSIRSFSENRQGGLHLFPADGLTRGACTSTPESKPWHDGAVREPRHALGPRTDALAAGPARSGLFRVRRPPCDA